MKLKNQMCKRHKLKNLSHTPLLIHLIPQSLWLVCVNSYSTSLFKYMQIWIYYYFFPFHMQKVTHYIYFYGLCLFSLVDLFISVCRELLTSFSQLHAMLPCSLFHYTLWHKKLDCFQYFAVMNNASGNNLNVCYFVQVGKSVCLG